MTDPEIQPSDQQEAGENPLDSRAQTPLLRSDA